MPNRIAPLPLVAVVFLIVSFLAFGATPRAAKAEVFDPDTFTLDNGLEVVVITNRRAPIVNHMIWYKVGAADEREAFLAAELSALDADRLAAAWGRRGVYAAAKRQLSKRELLRHGLANERDGRALSAQEGRA